MTTSLATRRATPADAPQVQPFAHDRAVFETLRSVLFDTSVPRDWRICRVNASGIAALAA